MRCAACLILVALVGCGQNSSKTWTRDEIADIADDAATDVSALESKIADLESENQTLEADLSEVKAKAEENENELARLRSNLNL